MRLRAGVGFDASEPGWMVVIELWVEPDMGPQDAIKFYLPTVFDTEDAALCEYMDNVRPNIIEPIIERSKSHGLTIEVLKTTAAEIRKAMTEAAQEHKQ